jgi:guanylate kinase
VKVLKLLSGKFFLLSILTILISCNNKQTQQITDKYGNSVKLKEVVNNQTAKSDSSVIYSFYLPKSYNAKDALPVIIFLDPHANGSLPLKNYASLANKYGYIFIGSNNLRNGLSGSYTQSVFNILLKEVSERFNIDEKRIFTAGFSGGAKLAILFTQQYPQIIGVAACGGSIPISSDRQPDFYYAGIVGNEDFNYLEVSQLFTVFNNAGFDYTSVVFDGGHQWPPVSSFESAIIGFEIFSIKSNRKEKNTEWIDNVWEKMNDSINILKKGKNIIQENICISQTSRWFYGLKNIKELKKRSYKIMRSQEFYNRIKHRQSLIQKEVKLRAEFIKAIENKDLDWWRKEIEQINKTSQNGDKEIAHISKRLLNYLSMVSYMLTKSDLDDDKLEKVTKKLKIYELVDPENPDVYLMYSRYYMLLGDNREMINNFKKAQSLNFTDYNIYKKEFSWEKLFANDNIKKLYESFTEK